MSFTDTSYRHAFWRLHPAKTAPAGPSREKAVLRYVFRNQVASAEQSAVFDDVCQHHHPDVNSIFYLLLVRVLNPKLQA